MIEDPADYSLLYPDLDIPLGYWDHQIGNEDTPITDDFTSISHLFDDSYQLGDCGYSDLPESRTHLDDGHHSAQFDSYGRNLDDMR